MDVVYVASSVEMCAQISVDHCVKCPLYLSDFNQNSDSFKFFVIFSNIKCHENPFSCSQDR